MERALHLAMPAAANPYSGTILRATAAAIASLSSPVGVEACAPLLRAACRVADLLDLLLELAAPNPRAQWPRLAAVYHAASEAERNRLRRAWRWLGHSSSPLRVERQPAEVVVDLEAVARDAGVWKALRSQATANTLIALARELELLMVQDPTLLADWKAITV